MTVYVENPKESVKKKFRTKKQVSKLARYKISILRLCCIYIHCNEHFKYEMKEVEM
jgi:hypothetical protein